MGKHLKQKSAPVKTELKELLVHRENLRPYLAHQEQQTQKRKEQDER